MKIVEEGVMVEMIKAADCVDDATNFSRIGSPTNRRSLFVAEFTTSFLGGTNDDDNPYMRIEPPRK